jgi:membrane associated rhomboid family serine protease
MQELKKIKKISLANITGLIYAVVGFLSVLFFSLYSLIKFAIGKNIDKTFFAWFFTNIGLDILISLAAALVVGIFGWIAGILTAALYNFFAREIGGIKIELAEEVIKPKNIIETKNNELFKY